MHALILRGLLLSKPIELPPRGDFKDPVGLLTVLDETTGTVFQLIAAKEIASTLDKAVVPCKVALGLRASSLSLAALTDGATKGRAYRLRVLSAVVEGEK